MINEEIKSRSVLRKSVLNVLFLTCYVTVILPVHGFYRLETGSLKLRGKIKTRSVWEQGAEENIWT
jgi:hypothetical protein